MSEPIGPGDWVECVSSGLSSKGDRVEAGRIYRVTAFKSWGARCANCGCANGHTGLVVETDKNGGWCPKRFRPIYRPKASLIQSLLKPIEADPTKEAAQ